MINYSCATENSGAEFLNIGTGVRPTGMGGAFCAVADDANGLYWNPAGLAQKTSQEITLMHNQWFQDINYEYLGWVSSYGKSKTQDSSGIKALGGSVSYLYIKDIIGRDNEGIKTQNFNAYDMNLALCYSQEITQNILTGINLKLISQTNEKESGTGMAIDIGGLYRTPSHKASLGLSIQNIGPKIKFIDKADPLPFNIKLGVTIKPFSWLVLALDNDFPMQSQSSFRGGCEVSVVKALSLRTGYKSRSDFDYSAHFNYGFGIKMDKYQLDYAFGNYGFLGDNHQVAFSIKFKE